MRSIYLDHNATTPLDPQVLEAMRPYWLAAGNPASRHSAGRAARRAWEQARETIAQILNAEPDEVIFTSGGTEANNLAILGLADAQAQKPGHVVASPLEHPAVSAPLERLKALGFQVDRPAVSHEGVADAGLMAAACSATTRFMTLILAHNETGAIQPVGDLVRQTRVPVHSDAVQAVGRIPVDFHALGVATLAASAHKFHGPAGAGFLLVRRGVKLTPQLVGGGQQEGRRAGTLAVALTVGMATALKSWCSEADLRAARWLALRDRLEKGLKTALGRERVIVNGPQDVSLRLPQTLNVGFPGVDGNALLMQLDLAGVAVSLGAACASGTTQPSPSFRAMHVPDDRIRSSIRLSLGVTTTQGEVDEALRRIVTVVERIGLRSNLSSSM